MHPRRAKAGAVSGSYFKWLNATIGGQTLNGTFGAGQQKQIGCLSSDYSAEKYASPNQDLKQAATLTRVEVSWLATAAQATLEKIDDSLARVVLVDGIEDKCVPAALVVMKLNILAGLL